MAGPSVTVSVTRKLPSDTGVPEIRPVVGFIVKPGGKALVATRTAGLVPLVVTWKVKGWPVRPLEAMLLVITGPEVGAGWMVRLRVAVPVPSPVAISVIW